MSDDEPFDFFAFLIQLIDFNNLIYHSVIRFLQYIDYSTISLGKVKIAHVVTPLVTKEKITSCMTILDIIDAEEKWSILLKEAGELFSGPMEGPEVKYIISSYRLLLSMLYGCLEECRRLKEISVIVNALEDPSLIEWDSFINKMGSFIEKMIDSWDDIIPAIILPPPLPSSMRISNLPMWEEKKSLLLEAIVTPSLNDEMQDISPSIAHELRRSFDCACRR